MTTVNKARIHIESVQEWLEQQTDSAYELTDPERDTEFNDEWVIKVIGADGSEYFIEQSAHEESFGYTVPYGHELDGFGYGDQSTESGVFKSWGYVNPASFHVENGELRFTVWAGDGLLVGIELVNERAEFTIHESGLTELQYPAE